MRPVNRLVLDTGAYSNLRAGHVQVLDHVSDALVVVMPVTVLGELEAAFELGRRTQENRRALAEFLAEPFASVLEVTTITVRYYARKFASLCRAGAPIPVNDVWIAAATMECNGHLLTFDRDFSRIMDLDHTLLETA